MSQFWSAFDRSRHKSTVQHKSELSLDGNNHGYIGKELANSEQIDVLSAMQDGTNLLKLCSRRTRSHWRKFQLDLSNTSIRWVSDKKDVTDTTIYISNIVEIICHSINIVKKFRDTLPEELNNNYHQLQQQQFTIRYLEHNKHSKEFIPSLSPNQSMTFNTSISNIQQPIAGNHHPSNSFIRSLTLKTKQIVMQPEYIDESVTDSSSNNNSDNNTGSFWKNWYRNRNKDKHNEKKQDIALTSVKTHSRQNTDSLKIPNHNTFINNSNFHQQDLHLMAETSKIATLWIYGLERLIALHQKNVDLSAIPSSHLQISIKELMNYSINKRVHRDDLLDDKLVLPFKERLDEINEGLYHIIELMPSSLQLLLEQNTKQYPTNNPLIKKVRHDQNDLDYILHQVSKARFDEENLKRWGYILTRIEMNLGAYQIALSNQKHMEGKYHKRQRSQSSTTYSSYGQPTFKIRQDSNSRYQRNGVSQLKNRTPRSPPKHGDIVMLQSPTSEAMQKYDSV